MTTPVYLHSGMPGAPQLTGDAGSFPSMLADCLVNGFNSQSVVSATAASGVLTLNFTSDPGFSALDQITVSGASEPLANGKHRVQSAANNQLLVAAPGVPDGAVGGALLVKMAPVGWTRPFYSADAAAFKMGGTSAFKPLWRVRDDGGGTLYARGFEDMTGADSGTGAFPSLATHSGDGMSSDYSANSWILVGTPRAVYVLVKKGGTVGAAFAPGNESMLLFFGEYARVGSPADQWAVGIGHDTYFPSSSLRTARSYTGDAGSGGVSAIAKVNSSAGLGAGLTYPDPASGGVTFTDAPAIFDDTGGVKLLRGFMPGMLTPLNCGVQSGVLACGHVLQNVPGVTGRVLLGSGYSYAKGDFALLLDEDWGDV